MLFKRDSYQQWFHRWLSRRHPQHNRLQLSSKQVYILPSSFGWAYALVVLTIGLGSVNYQLNAGFFFVFLLLVLGFYSLWQTHANLNQLIIECLPISDTEAGKPLELTLNIKSQHNSRFAIWFSFSDQNKTLLETLSSSSTLLTLTLPTRSRGFYKLPIVKVDTFYPFNLFHVWSYLHFDAHYFVYPKATSPGFWPEKMATSRSDGNQLIMGDEEVFEFKRTQNPWLQPSHIAWKLSSKTDYWLVKEMASPQKKEWLFQLNSSLTPDIERALSNMSYWIHQAEQLQHPYGIELNGIRTEIAHGAQHLQMCLRKLATFKA